MQRTLYVPLVRGGREDAAVGAALLDEWEETGSEGAEPATLVVVVVVVVEWGGGVGAWKR